MKFFKNFYYKQFKGPAGINLLFSIALPMIISQMAETMMLFTDRLFLSYLGKEHIAASMSGGLTSFMILSFFFGLIGYVNALVAQYFGAKQKNNCSMVSSQGFIISFLTYPLLISIIPIVLWYFENSGHDRNQIELESIYYKILAFGSIMVLLRLSISNFFSGLGKTRIVMFANIITMVVNIFANYVLIFGYFGFPRLEMAGAAYGTLIGSFVGLVVLLSFYFNKLHRDQYLTFKNLKYSKEILLKLVRFGSPAGFEFFLNITAFNFFIQTFYSYGKEIAAAITITFNWDLVAFLPLTGFGIAVTSLVGRYMGSGKPRLAQRAGFSGLKLASIYCLTAMIFFIFFSEQLVNFFIHEHTIDTPNNIVPIAVSMLRLAAIYIFADAINIILGSALRGAGDTRWVMFMSVSLHWITVIICFFLIRVVEAKPVTVWIVFVFFVCLISVPFYLRFRSEKWKKIKILSEPALLPKIIG